MVLVVKNPPANAEDATDVGSISGLGRSPGAENGNLLQYSCLGNPMDRGVWWAIIVHGSQKGQICLSTWLFTEGVRLKAAQWSAVDSGRKGVPCILCPSLPMRPQGCFWSESQAVLRISSFKI